MSFLHSELDISLPFPPHIGYYLPSHCLAEKRGWLAISISVSIGFVDLLSGDVGKD